MSAEGSAGAQGEARTQPAGGDLRLEATGETAAAALAAAVAAFGSLLAEGEIAARAWRPMALAADDLPTLLADLLEELLFRFETEGALPAALVVERLEGGALAGRLGWEPHDPARHAPGLGVKAVTWHDLEFGERDGRWQLAVLLDL